MKITGLSGQNYVAVGLITEKQLVFDGTAGDFFGAFNSGAIINLKGTARRFLGEGMAKGGIILQGNAQRGVGCAMTGGIIVVRGNVNGDIGQIMKGGTIIVSGISGPRTGAYMFGGELIVAGNLGEDIGLNMLGGVIYFGGKTRTLGYNAQIKELTINDESKLKKYFSHYGIDKDTGEFKKIVPITNNPWKDRAFDLKHTHDATRDSIGSETRINRVLYEITDKTKSGLLSFNGPAISDEKSHLDRLAVIPQQTKPTKDIKLLDSNLEMQITIGSKLEKPLVLEVPFILSSRGTGVVSKSCKMAFIFAAAKLKTALEFSGGIYPEESELITKHNGKSIRLWNTGKLGINLEYLANSDAIEIALGFGGVGGLTTIIPAEKNNSELAEMWQIPKGVDVILPQKMFDFDVPADLKRHVDLMREITENKIPIFIKLAAGNAYEDTKLALRAGADAIVLEGSEWCKQNLPTITSNHLGVPSISAIPQSLKAIKDSRADKRGVKLLVSGKFRNGADVFKALAMGADAVILGKAAEMAVGCTLCRNCNNNTCPEGIATTAPEREIKLDWVEASQKLQNYLMTVNAELKLLMLLAGYKSVEDIEINSLRAMDYHTAAVTGVPLAGYDKILPMWEH